MFEDDPRPNRDEAVDAICEIGVAAQEARKAGDGSLDPLVRCGQRHVLKTWPEYFEKILDGTKTFELREDDRGFDVGHELVLVEYSPVCDELTGRKVIRRVTYIMRGPSFGIDAGWCVMALSAPNVGLQRPRE